MTTHVNKRKEFREDRPPSGIDFDRNESKLYVKISRFDHILMTFQVFVFIGIIGLALAGTFEIANIIIFSTLLGLNILWIITNLKAKLSLSIYDEYLEFVFGKFNSTKISIDLNMIDVAKIESNIVGGTSYGGIPGLNSKTSTFRNLIIELKNGEEHYIPLLEESHKRYFTLLINKYKR